MAAFLAWGCVAAQAAAPANDSFAKATVILPSQGLSGTLANQSNVGATSELGEPNIGGAPAKHTLWYRFSAPTPLAVHIDVPDTIGLRMTFFGAQSGGGLESLQAQQSTNNTNPGDVEHLSASLAANFPLYLAVDADSPGQFSIDYRFSSATGDYFADAQVLPGGLGYAYGYTADATFEPGEPATATGDIHTVWFKWTAPTTAAYTFDTIGSSFDTAMDVFSGNAVGALTSLGANDSGIGAPDSAALVSINAVATTTYYIRVFGHTQATGYYILNYYPTGGKGQFAFHRTSINEATLGSTYAIGVRRLYGASGSASVTFSTSSGGPVANVDYTPINQVLNFAAGEIEKIVTLVTFKTGANTPPNFIVYESLSNPTNGAILAPSPNETSEGIFLEQPVSGNAPTLSLLAGSVTVVEGQTVSIPVFRQGDPNVAVTQAFNIVPAPGSVRQKAGVDLNQTINVQLPIGATSGFLSVNIPEDFIFEGPEDVGVQTFGSSVGTLKIVDDDPARPLAAVFESVQSNFTGLGAFDSRITLSSTGMVTGKIRSRAGSYSFKAAMAPDGRVSTFIPRTNGLGDLQVVLQFREALTKVHGHLQSASGDIVVDFDSIRGLLLDGRPERSSRTLYILHCIDGSRRRVRS